MGGHRAGDRHAFRVDVIPGVPDTDGSIAGRLWNDADHDGEPDSAAAETPLAGWTVFLDGDGDSSPDVGEPSQATDAAGNYIFTGLEPGTYLVAEVLPGGWEQTFPGDSAQFRHSVELDPREAVTGVDFGNHPRHVEIHGSVWDDLDGDGILTAGEPMLEGWTSYLDLNTNGQWDDGEPTCATDADGNFAFTDLEPGEYTVAEVCQSDWRRRIRESFVEQASRLQQEQPRWPRHKGTQPRRLRHKRAQPRRLHHKRARRAARRDSPIFVERKLGQSPERKLGQSPERKLGQSPRRVRAGVQSGEPLGAVRFAGRAAIDVRRAAARRSRVPGGLRPPERRLRHPGQGPGKLRLLLGVRHLWVAGEARFSEWADRPAISPRTTSRTRTAST